jgi:UPF0716 protein FxsA
LRFLSFILLAGFVVEVAAFVAVASLIGVLPAIGLAILTSIVGGVLLRVQGLSTLMRIQRVLDAGKPPAREMIDGVMIVLAAMLLMLPGFVTDLMGLFLFLPPVRTLVWTFLKSRIRIITAPFDRGGGGDRVIDLDAGDYRNEPDGTSPWRRIDHDR